MNQSRAAVNSDPHTHIFPFELFAAKLLDSIVQLLLSTEVGVGKYLAIESPGVCDDTRDICTYIPCICSCRRNVALTSDGSVVEEQVAVNATRW